MKVAYKHLLSFIPSKPSINDISSKFFQLGHEHEIHEGIFDMELTPNRGDCLSITGLLRDLSVFYQVNLDHEIYENNINPLKIDFKNKAVDGCSHISFLKIDIEKGIKPYRGLLQDYFDDLGVSKNNFFTDISNYISYEMGQPTHCYDAHKIKDEFSLEIIKGAYEFKTLVGKKIELTGKNLVFLDGDNSIINLAGVMGGIDTACSGETKSVIVECAYFNPEMIIGKSIQYDIKSDAAYRFERSVDPLCHEKVLRRFIKIVKDHARIKNIEIFQKNYLQYDANKIIFDQERLNNILGISLNKKEYENYLLPLGFKFIDNEIISPSFRGDIISENDIAEEIARIIGYNNIQAQPLKISKLTKINKNNNLLEQNIKNLLIEHGFYEVINNPFVNSSTENSIRVDNPLDSNRKFLRDSLERSLIENLLYNERRQQDSIKLFEISDVYFNNEHIKNKKLLGIICSGRVAKNYLDFSKKIDKNYLTNIFECFSNEININPSLISREFLDSKSKDQIIYTEIELDYFKNYELNEKYNYSKNLSYENFIKYDSISNYPSSTRDLSFSIKDKRRYHDLHAYILNFKNNLVKEIFVFDFFVNRKNNEIKLGIRFIFQSSDSTITEKEVNNIMDEIIKSSLAIDSVSLPGYSQ